MLPSRSIFAVLSERLRKLVAGKLKQLKTKRT